MRQSIDFCDSCGKVYRDSSGTERRYGSVWTDMTSADHQQTDRMRWELCHGCAVKARRAMVRTLGKGVKREGF